MVVWAVRFRKIGLVRSGSGFCALLAHFLVYFQLTSPLSLIWGVTFRYDARVPVFEVAEWQGLGCRSGGN